MGEGFLFANEPAISCPPILYVALAVLVSVWHGYRGFRLQWLARERPANGFSPLARWEKVLLFCLADGFFYLVCAAVGFAALWFAWSLVGAAFSPAVGIGFDVIWIFLVLLGVAGATGQLPHLIQLGKITPGR